ncbi:MAG: UPF0182 family protein [Dehalococcoidia bacterium]
MGYFDFGNSNKDNNQEDVFSFNSENLSLPKIPIKFIASIAFIIISLFVIGTLKSIYVDWLWFGSTDSSSSESYLPIYQSIHSAKIILFLVGFFISLIIISINIFIARKLSPKNTSNNILKQLGAPSASKISSIILFSIAIFIATTFGTSAASSWDILYKFVNSVQYNLTDPIFDRDISFYTFSLPAYKFIQSWTLGVLIFSTLFSGGIYLTSLSINNLSSIPKNTQRHIFVLIGLIIMTISAGIFLNIFNILLDSRGIVQGATYTDVIISLPVRYILGGMGLFIGLVTIVNAFLSTNYRLPIFLVGIWIFVSIIGSAILPSTIQQFTVDPNELQKEAPYIQRNIDYSRIAWGLSDIEEQTFPANRTVSKDEITANPETIDNIRILDPRPLKDTFNEIQSIRPFYKFTDVDVDRYTIDGKLSSVMIATRELDINNSGDRNWTRERLQLTHGFGSAIAPVNSVDNEGLPDLLTYNIPPQSSVEELAISTDGGRIYYGELTNHYVLVKTNEDEFDYPLDEGKNQSTRYTYDKGIKLDSFIKKSALAWELSDVNILISDQLGSDSRLLLHRNIFERVNKIAPFLLLDPDPYSIVIDGQLHWIHDAYTHTNAFPYSTNYGKDVNYIRNSVKVITNAQTGDIDLYLYDESDFIASTWNKVFPGLFKNEAEMPQSIKDHIRYPELLFQLQAEMYLKYHVTDANVFFVGEDFWSIPTEKFRQKEQEVEPYYVVMTLPGEENVEFALILPFNPQNRPNTIAWLAGRSDGENYGKLKAYRFPSDKQIPGPTQIEALIDQDPIISQQLSLWDSTGSEVIRGNLLMIPIGNSVLYVEPIYLQAATRKLPQLVRIVVANGNEIAMAEDFETALAQVLSPDKIKKIIESTVNESAELNSDTEKKSTSTTKESKAELAKSAEELLIEVENNIEKIKTIIGQLENNP